MRKVDQLRLQYSNFPMNNNKIHHKILNKTRKSNKKDRQEQSYEWDSNIRFYPPSKQQYLFASGYSPEKAPVCLYNLQIHENTLHKFVMNTIATYAVKFQSKQR